MHLSDQNDLLDLCLVQGVKIKEAIPIEVKSKVQLENNELEKRKNDFEKVNKTTKKRLKLRIYDPPDL